MRTCGQEEGVRDREDARKLVFIPVCFADITVEY